MLQNIATKHFRRASTWHVIPAQEILESDNLTSKCITQPSPKQCSKAVQALHRISITLIITRYCSGDIWCTVLTIWSLGYSFVDWQQTNLLNKGTHWEIKGRMSEYVQQRYIVVQQTLLVKFHYMQGDRSSMSKVSFILLHREREREIFNQFILDNLISNNDIEITSHQRRELSISVTMVVSSSCGEEDSESCRHARPRVYVFVIAESDFSGGLNLLSLEYENQMLRFFECLSFKPDIHRIVYVTSFKGKKVTSFIKIKPNTHGSRKPSIKIKM
ncbi:hypothetical protein WN51_13487 [Melipona quadrifasciata]|uniref:Uncharacterized protein n=1 Tax=Melipona quadrifasciata TaxID=166423 RepID=A0A0M9A276_9HYME|nr:hypothetical protein WN51_13487 [Melipona quadrifasciata]